MPNLQAVKEVVFGMNRNSTTRPHNMAGAFFQNAWENIKEYVHKMVVSFFCRYELPKFVTYTILVFLPKNLVINNFSDVRPISLSNFVNKIFSRIIHERIQKVLCDIISKKTSLVCSREYHCREYPSGSRDHN